MSSFILESAIFQEAEVVKHTGDKAIYKMCMQTAENINQNRRLYPKKVLDEGMGNCKERMQRRAFYGELDHPVPTGREIFDEIRQTTVLLKEVAHIIRDYQWEGNNLIGELETTTTPNGKILAGLLSDKSGLGLSMRGLASLKQQDDHNLVEGPLTVVSFDDVSLPSHKTAVVDFNEMRFESRDLLTERAGLVCCDGKCYLPDYFDKLVETEVITFFKRWV